MLLGMIGLLGAFLLGREILKNDLFVFIFAFIFSLAPRLVVFTLWEIPTRSLFMAFTPFFLWALLRTHKEPSRRNIGMLILFLFILATAHRLVVMILIIILAYILTYIFLMFMRILRLRFPTFMLRKSFRKIIPTISVILLFLIVGVVVISSGILEGYQAGALISGSEIHIRLINLGISLARSSGLLLPLIVLGSIYMAQRKNKELKEPFLIFTLVALIPTLFLRSYTGFYTIAFTSIFIAIGILYLYKLLHKRKRVAKAVVVSFLIISVGFSSFMIDYQRALVPGMSAEEYNIGVYMKYQEDGTTASNHGLLGSRMAAISGKAYLPVGGATTAFYGPEILTFGYEDRDDLNIVQIPIQDLTIESDSPFSIVGVQAQRDWAFIMKNTNDELSRKMKEKYDIRYALEIKEFAGYYFAYDNYYGSGLLISSDENRYKIYECDTARVWYVFS
jgi:hypothetical protein